MVIVCVLLIFFYHIILLSPLQALNEEVCGKQAEFDGLTEHAQILLQSTTDNRVTSQLTQMSARYTGLMAMSKVKTLLLSTLWIILWSHDFL